MNVKTKRCWTSILAFFLVVGILSCSGTKSQVVSDTGGENIQGEAKPQPEAISSPSTQPVAEPIAPSNIPASLPLPVLPAAGPVLAKTVASPQPPIKPALPLAPQPPPSMGRPQGGPQSEGVVFNFDNADIHEVIRVISEILKFTYIVDPRVKGTVNIKNSGQISPDNVFPIFQSILRLNGATAIKKKWDL